MSANTMVKAGLALTPGKHTHEPNIVIVPSGKKSFSVGVEWSLETEHNHVIGSHDPDDCHAWCVLDSHLKQVMQGTASSSVRKGPRKAEAIVGRTLQGGGSCNPHRTSFEFSSSKLKNGESYMLLASRHGVIAAGEFVAVHEPRLAAAKKERRARKKGSQKKSAKKAAPKKAAGKK